MRPLKIKKNGTKPLSRILITNDDGIDSRGIGILEDVARLFSDEVWVFAPDGNRSGSGRSLTITRDIKVTGHGENRYSCDGTPTDCMILALNGLMKDCRPDLVLSGINLGMNVGDDITCSGTIGAAWESVVHDVPAIALSQKINRKKMSEDDPEVFASSRHYAAGVIEALLIRGWPEGILMNINFPSVPAEEVMGVKAVHVGRHKASDQVIESEGGDGHYRIGMWRLRDDIDESADVGAVFEGYITVCPLRIDMADSEVKDSLSDISALF